MRMDFYCTKATCIFLTDNSVCLNLENAKRLLPIQLLFATIHLILSNLLKQNGDEHFVCY